MNIENNSKTSGQRCTICDYFNEGIPQYYRTLHRDPDKTRDSFVCGACYEAIRGAYLDYKMDEFTALDPSVKQRLWNVRHYPHRGEILPPGELEGLKRQYKWMAAGSRTKKPTLAPVRGLETEGDPLDRCLKGLPSAVDGDLGGGMGGSSQNE